MSGVDPSWPPPPEPRHRPHRAAYVFAVLMPLVLLVLLAAPAAITYGLWAWRRAAPAAPGYPGSQAGVPETGQPGVGDPYFPDYGSSGYDALAYVIALDWDAGTQSMTATTIITAKASQPLRSFYVDLALQVDAVEVDGRPAEFEKTGFQDVQITPAKPIADGAEFTVTVDYSGAPGELRRGNVAPWSSTGAEWTVAGEPESSAWWFPANDHPSDPALMNLSVRVPAGMEVLSVGRLESRDTGSDPDFDTWHWIATQPMATYLNFVSIGQFEIREGSADGRPYVYAVSEQLSSEDRDQAFRALQTSGQIITGLEAMFGPYPFTEIGGVVPAHQFPFDGLETQTRPVYDRKSIIDERFSRQLITHELTHMWFGDRVTVRQWNDIFVNEAYASWAEWGLAERAGRGSANAQLNGLYDRARDRDAFWQVTMIDPGPEQLFTTVYARGPMTLQALRNLIGDEAFFGLARSWSSGSGPGTVEEWMVRAQAATTIDLAPFFRAWILSPTAPDRTAANGFRR